MSAALFTRARASRQDKDDLEDRIRGAKKKYENAQKDRDAALLVEQAVLEGKLHQDEGLHRLLSAAREILSAKLDSLHGAEVRDQQIFRDHAARYEAEFLEDMRALGVRDATVLTRVTEYVDKIVEYVQRIIDNGFAYESNGSVYFDTVAFTKSHDYAKLSPQSRGNLELAEEGEGALAGGAKEKRNPADFALWKKSKPGEPSWPAKGWGAGRPGWHIECSVMASDVIGQQMDIHSGGTDLKFPHHDNELAQAEAHDTSQQWVNYFFHAGHLHIGGLKMSKSLKNFTTIRAVLNDYSARQLRILFLLQPWHLPMNFAEEQLEDARSKEKTIKEFFLNVKAALRGSADISKRRQQWTQAERELNAQLMHAQATVHRALQDNFDYPVGRALLTRVARARAGAWRMPTRASHADGHVRHVGVDQAD